MSKVMNTVFAIALFGFFPALVLYQVSNSPNYTEAQAVSIAEHFLMDMPTFSFDGVHGSMEILDVAIAESYPVQYFITVTFECSQAGYGDRTGMILAQVITRHEARVVIVQGEVMSAVIDGVWDEMDQRDVDGSDSYRSDEVVTAALDYIMDNYHVVSDIEVPEDWSVSLLSPEGIMGGMEVGYRSQGWEVVVNWAVVLEPVYTVEVRYGEFTWNITVDHKMNVEEVAVTEFIEVMTQDIAKDAGVYYVLGNVEGFMDLEEPEVWAF